jgi:hypothetical protein
MLSDRLMAIWIPVRSKLHGQIIHSNLKEVRTFDKLVYVLQFIDFLNIELEELLESKKISKKEKIALLKHGLSYILNNSTLNIPKLPKIAERFIWDYIANLIIRG